MANNGITAGGGPAATAAAAAGSNLNENPLITVSGDLADFMLTSLSSQIASDLGRESIDWHRSYDNPISVYLEASFVPLEEKKHYLAEAMVTKYHHSSSSNGYQPNSFTTATSSSSSSSQFSSIPYRVNNLTSQAQSSYNPNPSATTTTNSTSSAVSSAAAASVKRNHSFNVIRRNNSSFMNASGAALHSSAQEYPSDGNANGGKSSVDGTAQADELVNHSLVRLICNRALHTNGAHVLINSYWIDSALDLESYNQTVREPLLDWFSRVLANAAAKCRLGLASEFLLDCAIVIVCRHAGDKRSQGMMPGTPTKSNEQVLSLERLMAHPRNNPPQLPVTPHKSSLSVFKNGLSLSSNKNKFLKPSHNPSLNSALSSSLTSLNNPTSSSSSSAHLHSASSTNQLNSSSQPIPATAPLNPAQLIDQIRNDLSVCFQIFQQKQFSAGNFESNIPPNPSLVVSQLMERMLIYDHVMANSALSHHHQSHPNQSIDHHHAPPSQLSATSLVSSSSTNISSSPSTMKQLSSALSNFGSGGSIKITTPSMMMSPSKGGPKSKVVIPDSSALPTLRYPALVSRLRSLLLEAYSRQFESYERVIRRQRELRNKVDWDFFGFFLLQEELALAYENLGLYSKALIQYDELDALFSQSILNSGIGGIGPGWLQRRLICEVDDDDGPMMGPALGPLARSSSSSQHPHSPLYSAWNGLCLCNPESTKSLRHKIVQCVLEDDDLASGDEMTGNDDADSAFHSPSGPFSLGVVESAFSDPLGVNLGMRGAHSPSKSPRPSAISGHISLIDFRNYLFARQCHLLCLLNKPWELASRALPFLQMCVSELNLLDISIAPGGIACWVFLSVLEILHKCERYSDSSQLESYSYHTVGLWSYARDKLAELGTLCNLMPGSIDAKLNSSDHLHRMVELVAGMGADPHIRIGGGGASGGSAQSPQERLKNALSSSDDFLRNYLEITELTMGTYKHIGYIRSARLIGKELAGLYLKLEKPQQALPFLLDHYNLFQCEQWSVLKFEASKLMAQCLEALYSSAYESKPSNNDQDSEEQSEPAFNLEATIRSAFRTYLLLLVQHSTAGSIALAEQSIARDRGRYIESLRKLLENYARNGLKLREIYDRLNDGEDGSPQMASLNYTSPLLTIHNSHSDLFYDAYTSSSTMTLANSSTSLHRLNSTSSRSKLSVSEASLHTPGSHQQQSSGQSPNRPLPLRKGERFFQIRSVEIFSANQTNFGKHHHHHSTSSRSDRSFIAGSLLQLTIQVYSELSLTLSVEQLAVTMEAKLTETSVVARKKSATSITSGSSSAGTTGSSEYIDHTTQSEIKLDSQQQETPFATPVRNHPYAVMETQVGSEGAKMTCRNSDQLLRHRSSPSESGGLHGGVGGGSSSIKFLPQLPVSLLNQRLSDDHNNFRHYRYLGAQYRFDLVATTPTSDEGGQLALKPGLNTFQLIFQSPDQFTGPTAQSQHLNPNSQPGSTTQFNQLWFHLDQLVLLCRSDQLDEDEVKQNFMIVEDFAAYNNTANNSAQLSTNFRLVKCPPTVELVPQTDLEVAEQKSSSTGSLVKAPTFTSLLIGVDQLVTIRLNSGTNILPKGLKCYIKISPVISVGDVYSSSESTNTSSGPGNYDFRMVQVTLHPSEPIPGHKDDSVLYFYLDRQIDPFKTYELSLKLRSTFVKSQVCMVNQWAVPPSGGGQSGSNTNLGASLSSLNNPNLKSMSNSRDFTLSLSWSALDSTSPIQSVSASCQFTLYQPYHLYTKLHTCGRKKLIEVNLRGAAELATGSTNGKVLLVKPPALSHYHYSHNQRSKSSLTPVHQLHSSPAQILFKSLTAGAQKDQKPIILKPNAELHFVWDLVQDSSNTDTPPLSSSLKRFMVDFAFRDHKNETEFSSEVEPTWQEVQYEVRLGFEYQTRYIVREFIEPMTGQKNTELLRVGNSCLFRVTIERVFSSTKDEEGEDSNRVQDEDEFIMYELVFDSELWSLVSSYRSFLDPNANSTPGSSLTTTGYDSLTSNSTVSSDYSSFGPNSSEPQQQQSQPQIKLPEFNVSSKVLKLSTSEPVFEANFEMMPLGDGYIPLPSVRLSKYQPSLPTTSDEPESLTPLASLESISSTSTRADQQDGQTPSKHAQPNSMSNTIETLSAKLTENLSKSNWTSKLLANSAKKDKMADHSTASSNAVGSSGGGGSVKTGRLVAFESGQVYNYNRASQIYVLPQQQPQVQPSSSQQQSSQQVSSLVSTALVAQVPNADIGESASLLTASS